MAQKHGFQGRVGRRFGGVVAAVAGLLGRDSTRGLPAAPPVKPMEGFAPPSLGRIKVGGARTLSPHEAQRKKKRRRLEKAGRKAARMHAVAKRKKRAKQRARQP